MATQDLCALADVKTFLESAASGRDALISAMITPASDAIMQEVEREFKTTFGTNGNGVGTRTFRWDPGTRIVDLSPWDLQSASAIALSPEGSNQALTVGNNGSGVSVEAPDVLLRPINCPEGVFTSLQISDLVMVRVSNLLFRFGYMDVAVTGTWGWPSVPTQVKQACALTVATWVRKDVAAFGIEDYGGHGGDALMAEPQGYYSIPPAALKMLAPFRRFAGIL